MSQLRVVNAKGFQMEFDNGLTVSVMFGEGNYCQHRDAVGPSTVQLYGDKEQLRSFYRKPWESNLAEVAVWRRSDKKWAHLKTPWEGGEDYCPDPLGWVTAEDVAKIIAYVGHKDTYLTEGGYLGRKGEDVLNMDEGEE